MHVLFDRAARLSTASVLDDDDLRRLYKPPSSAWLRVNMVTTLDGAATGPGGVSGSINNAVDKKVFHMLRSMADVILVGAGTARTEGYRPAVRPLIVVSERGAVPPSLLGAQEGTVFLATSAAAGGLQEAREQLGAEHVIVAGETTVDLVGIRKALVARGWLQVLCEGGPVLLGHLLAAGLVDELCETFVPTLAGGGHPRIVAGAELGVSAQLAALVEADSTLLARWLLRHPS